MVTSILFVLAAFFVSIPILRIALPGFQRQKKLSNIASLLNKTDSEIAELNQNVFIRSAAKGMKKGDWLDKILGVKKRKMYRALNKTESYEHYLANIALKSLVGLPAPIFLSMTTGSLWLGGIALPLMALMLYSGLDKINKGYKERQNQLIKELPDLISKMIIALEVGRPLTEIFEGVSEHCDPLLGKLLKKLIADTNTMSMKDALQRFANEVNLDVMFDFVSVTNIILDKGFHEAESDLKSIKTDLRELRRLSMIELTKGNPAKMNTYYFMMIFIVIIFVFLMAQKIFGALTKL